MPPNRNHPSTMRLRARTTITFALLIGTFLTAPVQAEYDNLVQTFNLGADASRLITDPVRGLIYASITGANSVTVIDPTTLTIKKTLTVGAAPVGLAISADGDKLYVALSGVTQIGVIDLSTLIVLPSITTEIAPFDLVAGLGDRLYVIDTSLDAPALYQIDAVSGATQDVIGSSLGYPDISTDRKTLYARTASRIFTGHGLIRYDVSSPSATTLEYVFLGAAGQGLKLSHNQRFVCVPVISPDATMLFDANDFTTVYGSFPAPLGLSFVSFSSNDMYIFAFGHVYETESLLQVADAGANVRTALTTDITGRYLFQANGAIDVYDLLPDIYDSFYTTEDVPFAYQAPIFIANKSSSAIGLPDGLTFDQSTLVISGAATQNGVFPIVITISDGTNTAIVHVTLTVYHNSRAQNLSTRLLVQTGDDVLIGGFIINGSTSKQVVIRAIGPSLPITGSLVNPTLELHDSTGVVIAFNDDWAVDPQVLTLINLGFAPDFSEEAALYRVLPPGSYTMIVRGTDNASGIGLVEVYDLDSQDQTTMINGSRLANISTRGKIETGDNVMIGGFIVGGIDDADMVVRAIGPSLTSQGVSDALADPVLNLYDYQGVVVAFNDNWRDTQESAIEETGLAPMDDKESAIVISLAPGAYTAIVSGVKGAAGVGLVEAYNFP